MATAAVLMDTLAPTDDGDQVLAPATDGGILPMAVTGILAPVAQ